jgi:hypothetical protein
MAVQEKLYTADDLWEMSHRVGDAKRLELVKGVIREGAPTGGLHGVITDAQVVNINGVLDGDEVLPGFELPLRQVFESIEE